MRLDDAKRAEAHALDGLSAWSRIKTRRDACRRRIQWPGTDIDIDLELVTHDQIQESVAAAWARWKELGFPSPGEDLTFAEDFQDEVCLQLLWRACRDPEDPKRPICPSADRMRADTTVADRSAAYGLYRDLEDELDPDPDRMSQEMFDQITDAIKKKDPTTLRSFGSTTLASYLLSGDSPPSSSTDGGSSSGSSDDAPPTSG